MLTTQSSFITRKMHLHTKRKIENESMLPRQAKPAAEEANPAAVGKLLYEAMCTCNFSQSFFVILIPFFSSSILLARERISLKQFWYLPPEREISYTNQKKQRNPHSTHGGKQCPKNRNQCYCYVWFWENVENNGKETFICIL